MTINDTIGLFNSLLSQTDKKSERKIYNSFIGTLTALINSDLTELQLQSVEEKLNVLNLKANSENRKKYVTRKLAEFKAFLKDEFSFVSEGYYSGLGMTLGMILGGGIGMALGTGIGVIFGMSNGMVFGMTFGISLGAGFGMMIGLITGRKKDSDAENQNRVLKQN